MKPSTLYYLHISAIFVSIRKRVGGLKLEELPGLEALRVPGMWMYSCFDDQNALPQSYQLLLHMDASLKLQR